MKRYRLLFAFLIAYVVPAFAVGAPDPAAGGRWVGAWVSAQQLVEPHNLPPPPGLAGNTLRQIIRPSLGGDELRVTFSNAYGNGPLVIAAASVARSKGGSAIDPASVRPLTFGGGQSVTVQPGAAVISDPVQFALQAFEDLAVSTRCTAVPVNVTGHPGSRMTSFIRQGDFVSAPEFAEAATTEHWYLLEAVDVRAAQSARAIVVLGDSITDGRGSTTDRNNRWPDNLARRLAADSRTRDIAVLNQGIGGNRLLRQGLGPSALQRFDRDVLVPPGVRWLVILEGINDIGTAKGARAKGEPAATVPDILLAYEQMIVRAHAHGLRVYGATIMPFEGFGMYYDEQSEADRQAVNRWIRTSGKFDGVLDFDATMRDPQNLLRLSPQVDSGDHLHPSAGGYQVLADGIDLTLFQDAGGH